MYRSAIYTLNEHYFDNIDTSNKAYFLGLLFADGCNYTKSNSVILTLSEYNKEKNWDFHILKSFQKEIESNNPIKYRKRKNPRRNQWLFSFHNKYLSKKLLDLGLLDSSIKTGDIEFPYNYLSKDLYSHFIRGYFDGNGHIGFYEQKSISARLSITGNKYIISSIQDILVDRCGINKNKLSIKDNSYSCIWGGRNNIISLREYLYNNAHYYLERKKVIFFNIENTLGDKREKIDEYDVRKIRKRYENGESQVSIAKDFPIKRRAVGRIVNKERWKHVK